MKVAIIGSGISGLTSAWLLDNQGHHVTVFEKASYFGGHTDTHNITRPHQDLKIDTGFIVFNEKNYPLFTNMLQILDVNYQNSNMSFSVKNDISGMSYNPSKIKKLLTKPSNFLKPNFLIMLKDIKRFYKQCSLLDIEKLDNYITLESFLISENYSAHFAKEHIYPMAGALWSMSAQEVKQLPLKFVLGFFSHHQMLQIKNRPEWKTVSGGSQSYIKKLKEQMRNVEWKLQAVQSVQRSEDNVRLTLANAYNEKDAEVFDAVIFACHADNALELLNAPTSEETETLGAFEYSDNTMILHSDASIMPTNKGVWASWNVSIDKKTSSSPHYSITYWMNLLQNLDSDTQFFSSLNPYTEINPEKIWIRRQYRHPKYQAKGFAAQANQTLLNSKSRCFYCGAYWGWGFHEDGAKSAHAAVKQLLERYG